MVELDNEWNSLDTIAKANLKTDQLLEFYKYKYDLFKEGCSWKGEAVEILTGWIWEQINEI